MSQGGWCLPCILFLSQSGEKSGLGALVRLSFANHNRSKKLLQERFSVDCAYEFKKTWLNPTGSHSINSNAKNCRFNFEVFL